jgi:ABC-type dipeptide/oligopeptide/nickel transport system permease component
VAYLFYRLAATVPVLVGITLVVFVSLRLIPGDPAIIFAGERATQHDIEALRQQLGLDQPVYVQYGLFLANAVHGDLGRSIRSGLPVTEELEQRFPNTVLLAASSIGITVLFGVPLGIASAVRRRSLLDRASLLVSLAGISTPAFVLGVLLQLVFAVRLGLLPSAGIGTPQHLVLPALTLGAFSVANVARMTRVGMLEVLAEDYIRTARGKGLRERAVVIGHALRNALIPTITIVGLQFGYMLGGAVLTEVVFAWPGLGRYLVQSIFSRDYPAVQGAVLLLAGSYVVLNVLVDLLYRALDPRIRLAR